MRQSPPLGRGRETAPRRRPGPPATFDYGTRLLVDQERRSDLDDYPAGRCQVRAAAHEVRFPGLVLGFGFRQHSDDIEQAPDHIVDAGARHGGQAHDIASGGGFQFIGQPFGLFVVDGVTLVERDDLQRVGQTAAVGLDLLANRFVTVHRVVAGRVDQMQQYPATFHVAEEASAQSGAFAGAFDDARNVGQDELVVAATDYAQIWMKRRKG